MAKKRIETVAEAEEKAKRKAANKIPNPADVARKLKMRTDKKEEPALQKRVVDKQIERRTREEFATYYTPGRKLEDRKLLTVARAAKILGVTKRRVRSFINAGRLPAVKLNSLYLVKWSNLVFFDKQPRKSGAPFTSLFDE